MKHDTYSKLRSVNRQLEQLNADHVTAQNKLLARFNERQLRLGAEKAALLAEISGAKADVADSE